jgi:hypothetical protein
MFMMRTMAIVVDNSRPSPEAFNSAAKVSSGGMASGFGLAATLRQETAEVHATLHHVLVLGRILGKLQVGQFFQLVVRHRQFETIAEAANLLLVHLLLLVRNVHRFAGVAHAEALDGLGQDQGRGALALDGAVVGSEDLEDVVAATIQLPDFVVGPVGNQLRSSGVLKKCSRT